uniref:Uncharacterized protein n=1 Tax=Lepeophtheirus salmonis TaxID=72036 RepID=A0A0K2V6K5_LEPSM
MKKDGLSLAQSPGGGGLNKIRAPTFLDSVKEKKDRYPMKSMRKMV